MPQSPTLSSLATQRAGSRPSILSRRRLGRHLEGWLFASPWIVGFVLFTAGPMLFSAVMAFTRGDLITDPAFVGLDNWRLIFGGDPLIVTALRVTTLYAIVAVPLNVIFGVALALLLNTGVKGLRFYRTAFFMPSVLSGVAVALLWKWIFSGQFGLANFFLDLVGIEGPKW